MNGRDHQPIIDWLKLVGMVLILLGHLVGKYTNNLSPPIYPKQLGVAFFLFAAGFSLARERRSTLEAVFTRVFEVVLWGVATAALVSLHSYTTHGTVAASNYLPFLLGVNVLFNNFPANPTTWYIGTYIHVLLLWSAIRYVRISRALVASALCLEIVVRATLAGSVGLFVAYMALPNWITAFAAGLFAGQAAWTPRLPRPIVLTLAVALALSGAAVWPFIAERSFPFMMVGGPTPALSLLFTSMLVSLLYGGWTFVVCQLLWRAPTPRWVMFLARHTVIIFIGHMPLFFWLEPKLIAAGLPYDVRALVLMTACLPGLAALSALLHATLPVRRWRDRTWNVIAGAAQRSPAAV